jgi:hypothetical protein
MTITISSQLETHAREKALAQGLSVEAYVERLIRNDEWTSEEPLDPLDETDPDYLEIRAAVEEGLEQAERGEGRPADEVFAELRAKHGISH